MKRICAILMCLVMGFSLFTAFAEETAVSGKPKIVVLATGARSQAWARLVRQKAINPVP